MQFGHFQINVFVENRCHIDGGSMFGVVPKKIWAKVVETNPDNLVAMDTNLFVIRAGDKTILVDTGLGDMLTDRQRAMYGCFTPSNIEAGLARLGLLPDAIDFVVLTHLHLDHVGGAVKDDGSGKPMPRFPRAKYIVQKLEWEAANDPDERSEAAYSKSKFAPLYMSGQLTIIDGEYELLPGINLVRTGGHTAGHQGVIVTIGNERMFLFADIVPLAAHLRPAYVAAADLFPMETIRIKKTLMADLVANKWYLGFDHDTEIKLAKIEDTGLKLVARKVEM